MLLKSKLVLLDLIKKKTTNQTPHLGCLVRSGARKRATPTLQNPNTHKFIKLKGQIYSKSKSEIGLVIPIARGL
ncbi:hypothetical protein Hdeb2414_s0137g00809121 [Helianthus debilis subsp. tardiflorus]